VYPRATAAERRLFLREFARDPLRIASVTPSGRALARQMVLPVPMCGQPVVVELGAGTGPVTQAIRQRLAGRGRHLAVELNPRLARVLADRWPEVEVVEGDAVDISTILANRGLTRADVVVSGLPWTVFPESAPQPIVTAVADVLADTGAFAQFTYAATRWAKPARRQLARLRAGFEEVVVGRTVWRNLPPAVVLFARRPRRSPTRPDMASGVPAGAVAA
jgi:phosphatidylethanolamine/phosphatidyl-N-methylethanolamine N-methyltransferase